LDAALPVLGGFDLRDRTDAVVSVASGIPNRHPGVLVSGDVGRGVFARSPKWFC